MLENYQEVSGKENGKSLYKLSPPLALPRV